MFSILYKASNHQTVDKRISLNLLFKLSFLNSNHPQTLGYLNPALNNPTRPSAALLQSFVFSAHKVPKPSRPRDHGLRGKEWDQSKILVN